MTPETNYSTLFCLLFVPLGLPVLSLLFLVWLGGRVGQTLESVLTGVTRGVGRAIMEELTPIEMLRERQLVAQRRVR